METASIKNLGPWGTYFTFADTETSIFSPKRNRKIQTKSKILKYYLALHVILYDYVVVLDSSLLHNLSMEWLCKAKEPNYSIVSLLERGFIIPALREPCRDFNDLYNYFLPRRDGSLDWWGSNEYAGFLGSHLKHCLSLDNKQQWPGFRKFLTDGILDEDNSYFPSQKLPKKLKSQLLDLMTKLYDRQGYVPRGAIKNEYEKPEYKRYRKSLKELSDHIYYALTSKLVGTDLSYRASLSQKNYLQKKMMSDQNKNIGISQDILYEIDKIPTKAEPFKTFLLDPIFLTDELNFEQLFKAKDILKRKYGEYGEYQKYLKIILSGNISSKAIENLLKALHNYFKELEILISNHPMRKDYENLKRDYSFFMKLNRIKDLGEDFMIGKFLVEHILAALNIGPKFIDPIEHVLINIFTTYVGQNYLSPKEMEKGTKKKLLQDYISADQYGKYSEMPIKVAVETILKKEAPENKIILG